MHSPMNVKPVPRYDAGATAHQLAKLRTHLLAGRGIRREYKISILGAIQY
jgi:hypothetical protein